MTQNVCIMGVSDVRFVCLSITGEQEIQFSHRMRQDAVLVWTTSVRTVTCG